MHIPQFFPRGVTLCAAITLWACGGDRAPPLEPSTVEPAMLRALQDAGVTGPVAATRIGGRGSPSLIRLPEGSPAATHDPGSTGPQPLSIAQAADAPPQDLFFITNPAGGRYMENAPNEVTVEFSFFCISDEITQLFDVTIDELSQEAIDETGGHRGGHSGEKPIGAWDPDQGPATASGTFTTTYTSNIAAGDELMQLFWTANDAGSDCEGLSTLSEALIGVRYGGLQRVAESANLFFDVTTSDHFDVYFATPSTAARTQTAASNFAALSGAPMRLNSASLVFGGLYDIADNWAPPHTTHRIGTDMDIDGPSDTPTIWEQLILAGQAAGFRLCEVHNRNHVHCYGNSRSYSTF